MFFFHYTYIHTFFYKKLVLNSLPDYNRNIIPDYIRNTIGYCFNKRNIKKLLVLRLDLYFFIKKMCVYIQGVPRK